MLIAIKAARGVGRIRFYPASRSAETLAAIASTKTITPRVLKLAAEGLGAQILVVEGNNLAVAQLLSKYLIPQKNGKSKPT